MKRGQRAPLDRRVSHRWEHTGDRVAFLRCRWCGLEHTIGRLIGKQTGSSFGGHWHRFRGQPWQWSGALSGGGKNRRPECSRSTSIAPEAWRIIEAVRVRGKWHETLRCLQDVTPSHTCTGAPR